MNHKKIIPIFYACDNNFVKYTVVSLHSMMKNASKENYYRIYILHVDIDRNMQEQIEKLSEDYFTISFVDVGRYLDSVSSRLPIRDYYSKTTYYRLFIAEMFPEYGKAIYIDSDTIVLGDISELYGKEIGDYYIAAAHDQAMVQVDVFGTYVEKVMGISRNQFFNAGILLINCQAFRENRILNQFIEMLDIYTFVVTQDEDYLNVLCRDKVLWLEQQWNTMVFGEIPYSEDEFKIIHYIMVSKPWHYRDCRYNEYFWKYAQETFVYDQIVEELNCYTDEERERDRISGERLLQTAWYETNKEDNYWNILNRGTERSKERRMILDKIAKLEREKRFDEDAEEDPPAKELLPQDIDYLRTKITSKIKSRVAYSIARKYVNRLMKNGQFMVKEIKGLEHYTNLDSGAVITCNHFNAMDSFAMELAYEAANQTQRKFYRIIREGNYTNFPGFYGMLMRNCNTLPMSSNADTMKKFVKSVNKLLRDGHFVLVYPEQSMWWNYRKPKPLKKGAYSFAVRNNVPVLPCFITMADSEVKDEDGFFVQEYTIHIAPPIYPNTNVGRDENVRRMMEKNFEIWREIYETTYQIPLVYAEEVV